MRGHANTAEETARMTVPDKLRYLQPVLAHLFKHWPDNRTVNVVAHGHSVPSGYFATPKVNTFESYPHLLHLELKQRFPFAVMNMICTAIGGETSESGAARFAEQVLCHRPDVLFIDYGLNDRGIGLERAHAAWSQMIEQAIARDVKVILLTPTWDKTQLPDADVEEQQELIAHAEQVRNLAHHFGVGLADSFQAYADAVELEPLQNYLSWGNHPNEQGHQLVADALAEWFPAFWMDEKNT